MYLPTLRALFSLNAGDAATAIQSLQIASRFDLAVGGIGFNGRFGALYPVYVRGQAYIATHRPADAAAEFQRILDHRSIVLADPLDAIARLQLGRALARIPGRIDAYTVNIGGSIAGILLFTACSWWQLLSRTGKHSERSIFTAHFH